MVEGFGNIYDATVLLVVCNALVNPKTGGLLGGGVAQLTDMKSNQKNGVYWEFLPELPGGIKNYRDKQDIRLIPGTIKGILEISKHGKMKFQKTVKYLLDKGEKIEAIKQLVDQKTAEAKLDYELLNEIQNFYNSSKVQDKFFSDGANPWLPDDVLNYRADHNYTQRLLYKNLIIDAVIGPAAGTELFQILKLLNNDPGAFTKGDLNLKYIKYSYVAYELHNNLEAGVEMDNFQKEDLHIHNMMLTDSKLENLKKVENLSQKSTTPIRPFDVDTITIMHKGLCMNLMLTMGDSHFVRPGPGAGRPGASSKFLFPSFNNKTTYIDTTKSKSRPVLPFTPVYIKPRCGVCGLQASLGLQFRQNYLDENQMPMIASLQLIEKLNKIYDEAIAGLVASEEDYYKYRVVLDRCA